MEDKYDLIIKYDNNMDIDEYKYFFENLIKYDRKVLVPNYIYYSLKNLRDNKPISDEQALINEELKKSIDSSIKDSLNEYIRKSRQEIRNSIKMKNGSNLIKNFLLAIRKFGNKVNTLRTFVENFEFSGMYKCFLNTLFCDPCIHNTKLFSDQIMDTRKYKDVKYLILKIKKISKEFYDSWFLPFLEKCFREYLSFEELISVIDKSMVPVYKYSIFVNHYSKYKLNFNYISKDKNLLDSISSILVKDIISSISKYNDICSFNCFLKENYKSLNYLGKSLTKEKKELVEVYIANNTNSNINNDCTLDSICDFYVTISKYYSVTFPTICSLFCKKISQLITQKELYQELNELIIKTIRKDEQDIKVVSSESNTLKCDLEISNDSPVSSLVDIISNLNNKDIIFKNYHKFLMVRLINYYSEINFSSFNLIETISCQKEFERKLLGYLSKCFTNSQIYVLKKSLDDFYSSFDINNRINRNNLKSIDEIYDYRQLNQFNPIVISSNIWDLSILSNATTLKTYSEVIFDRTSKISNGSLLWKLYTFKSNYSNIYQNSRNLNWYLHVGKVEINYTTKNGISKLILLPIQFLILEQFDSSDEITLEEIESFDFLKSYPIEEIKNALNIFVSKNILTESSDIYYINDNFNTEYLDLRNMYFQVSNVLKQSIIKDNIKLSLERIDIVKSIANSIVKKSKCNREELFLECRKELKLFELEKDLFSDSIDYLLTRDYIREVNGIFEAIFY